MRLINLGSLLTLLPVTILSQSSSFTNSTTLTNSTTTLPNNNSTSNSTNNKNFSTSTGNDGTNPLIPTSISPQCQSFLQYLNGDTLLTSCTIPILSTLSLFTPTSSGNHFTGSSADINNTLTSLCSSSSCSGNHIVSTLNYFSGNCSEELQNGEAAVLGSYDVLYIMTPFTQSVCAKDVNSEYCLLDIVKGSIPSALPSGNSTVVSMNSTIVSTNSTTLSNTTVAQRFVQQLYTIHEIAGEALNPSSLYYSLADATKRFVKRDSSNSTSTQSTTSSNSTSSNSSSTTTNGSFTTTATAIEGLLPNSTTYRTTYLPFLFLSPSMSSSLLCTSCSQSVLANYITWESKVPYFSGLTNSPLLGGQADLWNGLGSKCGGAFLQSLNQKAGQASLSGAAGEGIKIGWKGVGVGVVGVGMAMMLM